MSVRAWNALIVALFLAVLACALFVVVASFARGVGAQEQAPSFTARWQRPGIARLVWTQPADVRETCLIRAPAAGISVLIGCWYDLPSSATGLTLGATGPMDAAFRPQAGDTFELTQDGATVARAQLRGVVVLPIFRR